MINYGSTPPLEAFHPPHKAHLENYRRLYASSEKRAGRHDSLLDTDALAEWFAMYDRLGAEHIVIKARS